MLGDSGGLEIWGSCVDKIMGDYVRPQAGRRRPLMRGEAMFCRKWPRPGSPAFCCRQRWRMADVDPKMKRETRLKLSFIQSGGLWSLLTKGEACVSYAQAGLIVMILPANRRAESPFLGEADLHPLASCSSGEFGKPHFWELSMISTCTVGVSEYLSHDRWLPCDAGAGPESCSSDSSLVRPRNSDRLRRCYGLLLVQIRGFT